MFSAEHVRATTPASHVPITEQMASRCRPILADLAVIDGELVGRERQRIVYRVPITGAWLADWAALHVPGWQRKGMTAADWTTVAESLAAWVLQRDAAAAAAVPPHERRLQRLDAERRMQARRVELEAERDRADAELAVLAGHPQQDTEPPAEPPAEPPSGLGGRLRRRPTAS